MSIRNLDQMFNPRSVAVIGASDKPKSVGAALTDNMLRAGYRGPVCVEVEDRTYEGSLASRQAALRQSAVFLRNFMPPRGGLK